MAREIIVPNRKQMSCRRPRAAGSNAGLAENPNLCPLLRRTGKLRRRPDLAARVGDRVTMTMETNQEGAREPPSTSRPAYRLHQRHTAVVLQPRPPTVCAIGMFDRPLVVRLLGTAVHAEEHPNRRHVPHRTPSRGREKNPGGATLS
jgi:hypothetical protein